MSHEINDTIPAEIHERWRAWLITGARRTAVDRRRMRGEHKGLKKILLDGLVASGGPHTWQDFSGAMVRHAVDDALRALPPEDARMVKLAYVGGYSNREIARQVGLTEGTVQRRLRRALAAISDHIQHGRAFVRRAVYGFGLLLSGRWLNDVAQHTWTATAVAGAAAVIVIIQPAPAPAAASGPGAGHSVAPARTVVPPVPSPSLPVTVSTPGANLPSVRSVQVPPVPLRVTVPTPSLPPPPVKI